MWKYSINHEKIFKRYHYDSINDIEFTNSQIYYSYQQKEMESTGKEIGLFSIPKDKALWDIISNRRSYSDSIKTSSIFNLSLLSEFLYLSFLGNSERSHRAYPSGGGLYLLNIYIVLNNNRVSKELITDGNYYKVNFYNNSIELIGNISWEELRDSYIQKELFEESQMAIVMAVDLDKISYKYNDISYKLIYLEAGHAGQNVQLGSVVLGLKSLPLQGFYDVELSRVLGNKEEIIYSLLVG
ncbi:SagB/ThcOx family dehydrogenase [Streptococcus sp. H31]|uniref:SagB/ThcOx family dehydrogenase n=1 Tax=Streptococcus huangxiaojuni TaxID=3237239 RepID=UPI0034A3A931